MSRFLAALILSAFCAAELSLAGCRSSAPALAGLAVGAWVILTIGSFFLQLSRSDDKQILGVAFALVVGTAATNLIVMATINLFAISAGRAFFLLSAGVLALTLASMLFSDAAQKATLRTKRAGLGHCESAELLKLAALCLIVLVWSRLQAGAFLSLQQSGVAQIWADYFLHGNEIAQYARADGLARGAILTLGEPASLYHRATFVLPAAIMQLADIPPYVAASALLLPMGLLLCLVGVAKLGDSLSQKGLAGLLAAGFLVVLPDASSYGMHNGYFGFNWVTFAHPGTGWAVGICAISLSLICSWLRVGGRALFTLAAGLAVAVFWHRAHLFIQFAPVIALFAISARIDSGVIDPRRLALLKRAAMAMMAACVIGWMLPASRALWLQLSAVDLFLLGVHGSMEPTHYTGGYAYLLEHLGAGFAIPLGVMMVVLAALGLLALTFPLLFDAKRRRFGATASDASPFLLGVVFLAILFFAPVAPSGDTTEYQHRGFPLLYAVTLTYCVVYTSLLLGGIRKAPGFLPKGIRLGLIALLLAGGAVRLWSHDPSIPRFSWGSEFHSVSVDEGVLSTGEYLRLQSGGYDVLAVVPAEPRARLNDTASRLVALSGFSAFIARSGLHFFRSASVNDERLAILNRIARMRSRKAAFRTLRKHGINWMIASEAGALAWDVEGTKADFRDGSFTAYRVTDVR